MSKLWGSIINKPEWYASHQRDHTHWLHFSKWRKTYLKSDYHFFIIKKGEHITKTISLFCTWAQIIWNSSPVSPLMGRPHAVHPGFNSGEHTAGGVHEGHVHLSVQERRLGQFCLVLSIGGKSSIFESVFCFVLMNSNYFSLYLLR